MSEDVAVPLLKFLGNLLGAEDAIVEEFITRWPIIALLKYAQKHSSDKVRKEACFGLSNIAASTDPSLLSRLFSEDIVPSLLAVVRMDTFDVRKEALWVLSGIVANGAEEHLDYFMARADFMETLVEMMDSDDVNVMELCLDTMHNLLLYGDSLAVSENPAYAMLSSFGINDKLDLLLEHPNTDVYDKAIAILEDFFERELSFDFDQDDYRFDLGEVLQPPTQGFQF